MLSQSLGLQFYNLHFKISTKETLKFNTPVVVFLVTMTTYLRKTNLSEEEFISFQWLMCHGG